MDVYSVRLGLANLPAAAGLTTLYTVPAGKTAIVKCLTAYPGVAGANTGVWVVAGLALLYVAVTAPASAIERELQLVLQAGETLQFITTAGQLAVSAHGYRLPA